MGEPVAVRPLVRAGAIAGFLGIACIIASTAKFVEPAPVSVDEIDLEEPTGATSDPKQRQQQPPLPIPSKGDLERIKPREPLSELSLALPPKLAMPDKWDGTILYRPVAKSAGLIQAMGYSVAIAGIDIVGSDEKCTDDGHSWDCGAVARTAFRGFLRGRAPSCIVPPKPDRQIITAECRVGGQDVGAWLVSNGWARASKGGRYEEAEGTARKAGRGLFGAPPSRTVPGNLQPATPPVDITLPTDPQEPFE